MFGRLSRHSWILDPAVGVRTMGPNELEWLERAVAVLAGTALDGGEQFDVVMTLSGHVRAIVQQAAARGAVEQAVVTAPKGREGRFPALAAAFAVAARNSTEDETLQFGIARILDGVELLVASRENDMTDRGVL